MTYGTILAVVDGRTGSRVVAEASLALGARLKATVTWLHVVGDPQDDLVSVTEGFTGAVSAQLLERLQEVEEGRLATARRLFQELVVEKGLAVAEDDALPTAGHFSVALRLCHGTEAREVERAGRLVDLVVAARPGPEGDAASPQVLQTAIVDSGRPVLTLPDEVGFDPEGRVAIAWDCSRESAKAVTAALPLLRQAKNVEIITAREGDESCQPSQLLGYLAAQGITAETWAFTAEKGSLGKAILEQCEKANCGLLVMGAYGHSPLREMVLGGVTRDVLKLASIPVLVAR